MSRHPNTYLSKNFLIGILLTQLPIILYLPVTNYFYYGGGWPFVQIVFSIIFIVGAVYLIRSNAHWLVKLILTTWWIAWGLIASNS